MSEILIAQVAGLQTALGLKIDSLLNGGSGTTIASVSGTALTINTLSPGTGMAAFTFSGGSVVINVNAGTGANQIVQLGSDAKLPAVDGSKLIGISTPGTAVSNQIFMSNGINGTFWSTATYPGVISINQILYAANNNLISGLAPVVSSVLTSSNTGVPTWSNTLSVASVAVTGGTAPAIGIYSGATNSLSISANSNEVVRFTGVSSGSVFLTITNATGGGNPSIVPSANNIVLGGGDLPTASTTGYTMINTTTGVPSGVPVGAGTGAVAIVVDRINHLLWFYDTQWNSLTGGTSVTVFFDIMARAPFFDCF